VEQQGVTSIAAVWDGVPMQRCTVHKHRNLLAHAPERLHDDVTADYTDMIYAATPEEIATRRKAFIRKWRLKYRAVADSLEEAGDHLFTFTRRTTSTLPSASVTIFAGSSIQKPKFSSMVDEVLPFGASTITTFFCWAVEVAAS
jgi:hypothetical protein